MVQTFSEYKLSLALPLFIISCFVLLFFYGPISYTFNIGTLFLIFLFYFSYLLGWFYFNFLPKKNFFYKKSEGESSQILNITTMLSFFTGVYIVVIFYDFFIIGDVFGVGITETREIRTLEGSRGSGIGFLVILFTGAPLLLLMSLLSYSELQKKQNLFIYKAQFLFSIIGLFSYFLSGGRNNFAIAMIIIFLALVILKKIKRVTVVHKKINKLLFKGLIFFVILIIFLFMLYIFIERANYQGITIYSYVLRMEREFFISVVHFEFTEGVVKEFYYAFIVFLFYLNHPIMLMSEYFDLNFSAFTHGALSFPLPTMLYDLVFGTSVFSTALDRLIVKGVYLSMPGVFFIDFGFLGVILSGLLLGFLVPFFLKRSQSQNNTNYYSLVLASIFLCTVILAPMYNILSSLGFSLLLMLLIVYILLFFKKLIFIRGFS